MHQIACCFGFGATAICPYLEYASVRQLVTATGVPARKAMAKYRKAHEKGILKIMSKIGGIEFSEIAEKSIDRHNKSYQSVVWYRELLNLGDPGYNHYRKSGERHVYTTEVIKNFHGFVKSGIAS